MTGCSSSKLERDQFVVIAGWHFASRGLKDSDLVIAELGIQPLDGIRVLVQAIYSDFEFIPLPSWTEGAISIPTSVSEPPPAAEHYPYLSRYSNYSEETLFNP